MHESIHIAVVDDDDRFRLSLANLLRSYGMLTSVYHSAYQYLAADTGSVDGLVADLQMPGMDGIELLKAVRTSGRPIPVFLLTAFPEEAVQRRAQAAGASCFFSKPVDAEKLLVCIQSFIGDRGGGVI